MCFSLGVFGWIFSFFKAHTLLLQRTIYCTITVNRTGSTAGAASVTVVSLDGTALLDQIFTAVSQILTWGAGDSAATRLSLLLSKMMRLLKEAKILLKAFYFPVGDGTGGDTAIVTITDYEEGKVSIFIFNFLGRRICKHCHY